MKWYEWLVVVGIVAIMVLIIGFSFNESAKQREADEKCELVCSPRVSQVINRKCHCKTETTWELHEVK